MGSYQLPPGAAMKNPSVLRVASGLWTVKDWAQIHAPRMSLLGEGQQMGAKGKGKWGSSKSWWKMCFWKNASWRTNLVAAKQTYLFMPLSAIFLKFLCTEAGLQPSHDCVKLNHSLHCLLFS